MTLDFRFSWVVLRLTVWATLFGLPCFELVAICVVSSDFRRCDFTRFMWTPPIWAMSWIDLNWMGLQHNTRALRSSKRHFGKWWRDVLPTFIGYSPASGRFVGVVKCDPFSHH